MRSKFLDQAKKVKVTDTTRLSELVHVLINLNNAREKMQQFEPADDIQVQLQKQVYIWIGNAESEVMELMKGEMS